MGGGGGGGGCFAAFIPFFLNIPWKSNNLVSLRAGRGVQANPLWIRHCISFEKIKLKGPSLLLVISN